MGEQGYGKPDGSRQRWALAFIGDTLSPQGKSCRKCLWWICRKTMPTMPKLGRLPCRNGNNLTGPSVGVQQRRLTYTGHRNYPGVATTPRHWLRSSPDGSAIAFLMQDDRGIVQLWTVSPNGGEANQVTQADHSIQSAFSWHPQGQDCTGV